MNIYEFPPIALLVNAAYWLVTGLSDLLEPLAGQGSAVLAIVLLTVIVRSLLIPVGLSQVRAGITRRRIAPRLQELQTKHRKNPELLQQKIMELYREEKASPFAGCLPVLAQMPVLMAVYGIFIQSTISGHTNTLLDHSLFGVPLSSSLVSLIGSGDITLASGLVYAVLIGGIAVVAQLSRRLLAESMPPPTPTDQPAQDLSGLTRALGLMPFLTAVFAAFVPLAATVYLMTTTTWTLCERLTLNRLLGATREPAPASETPR
ncbi:YidC/Oxa1 family membrane protein insertase [Brevibacterium sanguinis]|uniref:Membrane protein insertase YidC n=2 Tax=Brevibacterium TaxID=1696 RepID=A0A366IEZ4_9MICO|nr:MULTISPECIES: YidC/Oxa1 family membrane protein insertase [Brevibacterium]RBP63449.1 YidC/Oxa1 family membrane protein insertase [Brevibacterium sanguinis]RBP69916.1 YidC/Oxa1 family membrane protein insertase [Brevibacterium celere]